MRTFFVQNFGCRATQADGAALEALLSARGLVASPERAQADLVVLNTCTVTSEADSDARQTARRVHRENGAARILVTGCYAQRAPEELAALPGVEWVVGNSHKTEIANLVTIAPEGTPYHGNIYVGDILSQRDFLSAPVEDAAGDRTRPNLKIQDGCNNRCSFCIIPFVRGRSRSAPVPRTPWNCRAAYEWGHHVTIGRAAGLTDEEIARVPRGPAAAGWSAFDAALLRAADELHADAVLSEASWTALAARYPERQLIEVPMVVGQYHMVAFLVNSLGVEPDPGSPPLPVS